eukprot:m.100360 g.100360  ORF g.100360 m.100360 type:complete len:132 (-) comp13169_c1_seq1:381-776(-)
MAQSRLRSIVLLVRNVPKSVQFYEQGIGLTPAVANDAFAHFSAGQGVGFSLQGVDDGQEATLSTGYSPFLNFEVNDFDERLPRILSLGGHLDGAIKYEPTGKVASIRTPDGHMVGLLEPNTAKAEVYHKAN